MPVRVIDVELSAPLPALGALSGVTGLLVLVRWHGRPIGLMRIPVAGGVTSSACWNQGTLQAALESQVSLLGTLEQEPVTPAPPISIVVCTRDRPDLLHTCLEALRSQAASGHQVIIVDNAPRSDATINLVERYPYRYVCEPTPGLNHARNRGLTIAQHDLVAFTDDDCVPDPAWASGLAMPFQDRHIGAVTGAVMPLELETLAQERFEAYCANRRIFRQRSFQAPETPPSAAGVVGMGANMAFRHALLQRIGGFDVRFDGGTPTLSGGDTEMFARLLAAGTTIVYCPDALVWHRHCRDMTQLRKVIFGYGVGLYAVLTKRLLEDCDWGVCLTAPRWLVGPPLKALGNWLRGKPVTSPDLLLCELWGALHGPLRYLATRHGAALPVR